MFLTRRRTGFALRTTTCGPWPAGCEVLGSEGIWHCLAGETCAERSPIAKSPRVIEAFHRPFLDQIRAKGRLFERGLALQYELRSGPCLGCFRKARAVEAWHADIPPGHLPRAGRGGASLSGRAMRGLI